MGCTVLHSLSLLSSSFVEEEHQTWYFFTSTFHALLLLHPISCLVVQYGLSRVSESTKSVRQTFRDGISGSANTQDLGALSAMRFSKTRNKVTSDRCSAHPQEKQRDMALPQGLSVEQCVKMVASLVGILFLFRVLRRWNQTGNKWLDIPDVGDWLVR